MEKGVGSTRINEIASRAGVDQPLIHYYFPNLENLYSDIVEELLSSLKHYTLSGIENGKESSTEVLKLYIRAPFKWSKENPGYFSLWMYFYYLATFSEKFTAINKIIRAEGRDRISVILYRGIESGEFKKPANMSVSDLVVFVQGLISGNTILAGTEGGEAFETYAEITIRSVLDQLEVQEGKKKKARN